MRTEYCQKGGLMSRTKIVKKSKRCIMKIMFTGMKSGTEKSNWHIDFEPKASQPEPREDPVEKNHVSAESPTILALNLRIRFIHTPPHRQLC